MDEEKEHKSIIMNLWEKFSGKKQNKREEVEQKEKTIDSPIEPIENTTRTLASKTVTGRDGISVTVTPNKMLASVYVIRPKRILDGNGILQNPVEITLDLLKSIIVESGVKYELDEAALERIIEKKEFDISVAISKGVPPVDGKDGEVKDMFERDTKLEFERKTDGSVDFKSMNLVRNINKGVVICNIVPQTEPVEGIDVYANIVKGKPGKPPNVPQGVNTLVEDNKLVALANGNLKYASGKFNIDKILEIAADVDNAVGNIDFVGDVVIKGDVFEGYEIKAGGNITVRGVVTGSDITCEGDLTIQGGANGMRKATLECKGSLKAKYLESYTVKSGGGISAESIVNSIVACNDKIVVTSGGRGAIIGGTCTALKSIEAKVIGARSNIPTIIVLGETPDTIERKLKLEETIKKLKSEGEEISKNINYLETLAKKAPLNNMRQTMLMKMKKERPVNMIRRSQAEKALEQINETIADISECRLKCTQIHPPTRVHIGNQMLLITDSFTGRCTFYLDEGEVKVSYS